MSMAIVETTAEVVVQNLMLYKELFLTQMEINFRFSNSAVTVHVWGPGNIGDGDRMYNIAMDGTSHYEQQVADGIYAFHASARMPLNSQMIRVDLESADDISPSIQQA